MRVILRRTRTGRTASLALVTTIAVLATAMVAAPAPAATPCTNPPRTFPTSQMTRGMTGVGYTVIEGTTIVPFDVEILGVMPDAIFLGVDIVVARMTGPPSVVDVTGGAVAGMSGSPVYINGQLAGALAWAVAQDRNIFGMTAAEDMVGLFSLDGGSTALPARVPLTPAIRRTAGLSSTAVLEALPVPLGVSGLNGRPLSEIEGVFAERGVRVAAFRAGSVAAPAQATLDPTPFAPGDGLGVALSYGDVSWYGFGTATAVCGDTVIGFGHPMFWGRGEVSLGMNEVDVIAIDNGPFWGTKIGVLGDARGELTQDRFAGVVGVFGQLPDTIPVTSDVSSPDTGYARHGRTDIAWDEGWVVAELSFYHAWSNLTYVAQEDGPGTLSFGWTITGTREDGSTFTVSNRTMEYSPWAAASGAWRMADAIYTLAYNPFERVELTGVDQTGWITEEDLTSEIARVRVASSLQPSLKERGLLKAAPGDRITVEVTLDAIASDTEVVATFSLKVPRAAEGSETVRIRGGKGRADPYPDTGSLDDLIAALNGGDHRNDLFVRGFGRELLRVLDVIVGGRAAFVVRVVR